MAVIINELEVVLEPPPAQAKPGDTRPEPKAPQLTPQDLASILNRDHRTRLRLHAH